MSPLERLEALAQANGAELTMRYEKYAESPGASLLTWSVEWRRTGPAGTEYVERYSNDLLIACDRVVGAVSSFDLRQPKGA